jgi:hypothetical protein
METTTMTFDTEFAQLKKRATKHDFFHFHGGCWRTAVSSHFKRIAIAKPQVGIYILRASNGEPLYVGKGGTVKRCGGFSKQTLPGRLKNVRGKYKETKKYISSQDWIEGIVKEYGTVKIEYLLFDTNALLAPAYAEACLLQAYLESHERTLPPKNECF